MMKNNFYTFSKKVILVFLLIMSVFPIAACSKNDSGSVQDKEYSYVFNEGISLGGKRLLIPSFDSVYSTSGICVWDDKAYYISEGEYDGSLNMYKTYVNMCDLSDGKVTELFQINMGENAGDESDGYKSVNIEGVGADDNGNITVIAEIIETNDEGMEIGYTLKKYTYTDGGQIQDVFDINMDKNKCPDESFIKGCRISRKGDIYIMYGTFGNENEYALLCRFNPDGSAASECELKNMAVSDILLDADDRPIVTYGEDPSKTDYHTSAMYIDMDKGPQGSQGPKLDGIINGTDGIYRIFSLYSGSSDGTLIVNDSKTLSFYDTSAGTESKICDCMDSGLLGSHVIYACTCKNGNIFCFYNDGDSSGSYLEDVKVGFMEKRDLSDDNRPVIKVADLFDSDALQKDIISLNRNNDKYRTEYISYGQYEDNVGKMRYDIISGNVPDVIILDNRMDINNFIAKGFLEDLSPYVKKDETVNEDYFLDGFLDAISTDGKNYFLAGGFGISVLVGKKSDLSGFGDGWSVDEFIEYYKSKPEGTNLFVNMTKQGLCFSLLGHNMGKFIDWDEGKCSFDGDEFKKLLEFCAGFENGDMFADDEYEMDSHVSLIKKGRLLLEKAYIGSAADVNIYNTVFDGDQMFIGYPSDEDSGIYIETGGIGMMSSSEYKDEAWDFIKYYITDGNMHTASSSKEGFEKIFAEESVPQSEGISTYNGLVVQPAKREDADTVKELVKKAKYNPYFYSQYEIIEGELDSYFAGEKGLDDTVRVIQDRMEKYVNENK